MSQDLIAVREVLLLNTLLQLQGSCMASFCQPATFLQKKTIIQNVINTFLSRQILNSSHWKIFFMHDSYL